MKALLLTFGILSATFFNGYSQDNSAKVERSTEKIISKLKEVCNINEEQTRRVRPFVETYAKACAANKEKYAKDPDGLKLANKTAIDNYIEQLKTVLSPDQIQEYVASQHQTMASLGTKMAVRKDSTH